jgi:hypothetical protein
MGIHVRTVTAAVVLIAGIAGCSHMTTGTATMRPQPDPETRRSIAPTIPRSTIPRSTSPRTSSNVPPPSNSLTITCKDYLDLDKASKIAVVEEILKQEGSVLDPTTSDISQTLADAVCQYLPNSTVKEILIGGPVP